MSCSGRGTTSAARASRQSSPATAATHNTHTTRAARHNTRPATRPTPPPPRNATRRNEEGVSRATNPNPKEEDRARPPRRRVRRRRTRAARERGGRRGVHIVHCDGGDAVTEWFGPSAAQRGGRQADSIRGQHGGKQQAVRGRPQAAAPRQTAGSTAANSGLYRGRPQAASRPAAIHGARRATLKRSSGCSHGQSTFHFTHSRASSCATPASCSGNAASMSPFEMRRSMLTPQPCCCVGASETSEDRRRGRERRTPEEEEDDEQDARS